MKEMQKDYLLFNLEDFISDDLFIKWAQGKLPQKETFWEDYIKNNPGQKYMILEAKDLVANINFELPAVADDFFERLNVRINSSVDQEILAQQDLVSKNSTQKSENQEISSPETTAQNSEVQKNSDQEPIAQNSKVEEGTDQDTSSIKTTAQNSTDLEVTINAVNQHNTNDDFAFAKERKKTKNYNIAFRVAIGIAASLLIVLTYVFYPRNVVIENGFAGIKEIILPDSSVVLLNANSTLTYPNNWDQSNRQVKLSGEAFFKIRHQINNGHVVPFKVELKEVDLHVLGTSFNVISKPEQVDVVLKTGRLKVTHDDQEVFMTPADHLVYNQLQNKFMVNKVDNEDYLDWTRMEFVFNNLTVGQVTDKLAAYFDLKFHFEEEEVKNEKLSGRLGMSDQQETLHTLELLLNKKIIVNKMDVTIIR